MLCNLYSCLQCNAPVYLLGNGVFWTHIYIRKFNKTFLFFIYPLLFESFAHSHHPEYNNYKWYPSPILCCWLSSLPLTNINELILLLRFTNELSHSSFRENIQIQIKRTRHKSINLAQHTVHDTQYVGSTKKIEKKCDAQNSFIERKKGEMMNDFVEWPMMCVLN